jgi:DNA-directed RNA polymerase specialized sigma subunit, sigma24 homolog
MDSNTFGQTYLQNESTIILILRRLGIYDDDLLHDTYIAVYQHSQHTAINDFTRTFISFYRVRHKRRGEYNSHYLACDNTTIEQTYDCCDETDLEHREQVAARVDQVIENLKARPLPGERNRKLAIKIIRLYRQGLTFHEIAKKLKTSPQAVQQLLCRTIEKIRASC